MYSSGFTLRCHVNCRNRNKVNKCVCVNGNCKWSSTCGIMNERSRISPEKETVDSIRTIKIQGMGTLIIALETLTALNFDRLTRHFIFRRYIYQLERLHRLHLDLGRKINKNNQTSSVKTCFVIRSCRK